MAMKEASLSNAQSITDLKKLKAFYIGKRVETIAATESEPSRTVKIHYFANDEGIIELWGFVQLDLKLRSVIPGMYTELEYLGKMQDGEKNIHQVKVLYDPERILSKEKVNDLKTSLEIS